MTRLPVALLTATAICLAAAVADDKPKPADDPVAAELTKAKEDYQAASKAAGEKLLAAFAGEQKKLEGNTKLKVAEQIKLVELIQEERKAFEADPAKLPKSAVMKVAVSDYQTKTAAAKKKCEAAFDKAAEGYRGKKDLATAKVVIAEKEQYFKGTAAGPRERAAVQIVGRWSWIPGYTMVFEKGGGVTELDPMGGLNTKGKWAAQDDGTVTFDLDNGWKAKARFQDKDKLKCYSVGPKGERSEVDASRLLK